MLPNSNHHRLADALSIFVVFLKMFLDNLRHFVPTVIANEPVGKRVQTVRLHDLYGHLNSQATMLPRAVALPFHAVEELEETNSFGQVTRCCYFRLREWSNVGFQPRVRRIDRAVVREHFGPLERGRAEVDDSVI